MEQLTIGGLAEEPAQGEWITIYARVRSDGTRMSVSLPPRRDCVLIKVGSYHVRLEHGELVRVSDALDAAREAL